MDNILILSASAGTGHVMAARAVLEAVKRQAPETAVEHLDALQLAHNPLKFLYSKGYMWAVRHAPSLFAVAYNATDLPSAKDFKRTSLERLCGKPLIRFLEAKNPSAVVCTHFFPAYIASLLRRTGRISSKVITVVTDFDVHGTWVSEGCSHYCVPSEQARETLCSLGVLREQITITGNPVRQEFCTAHDPFKIRAELGLRSDRPTLLISAGSFSAVPVETLIPQILSLQTPLQAIILCGSDETTLRKVKELISRYPNVPSLALGMTDRMSELMAASDLIVSKPGGLSVAEALSQGLAFVGINPIPGQEERNLDYLMEQGSAIRVRSPETLRWRIASLLEGETLSRMQHCARVLAKPEAAERIAALVSGVSEPVTTPGVTLAGQGVVTH